MALLSQLKVTGQDPFPLELHTSNVVNGNVFVFGGQEPKTKKISNALHFLNMGLIFCDPTDYVKGGLKSWSVPKG
jgi:hypothetical protein